MKAIDTTVEASFAEVEQVAKQALANQGFGVLTEIDVAKTLQEKLGIQRPALKILGACNPSIAHKAIEEDPSVVLALPCNVVIETVLSENSQTAAADKTGKGTIRVAAADPEQFLNAELANQAKTKLQAVMENLQSAFSNKG
ncbi:MAG: DUF302 domain-containing protein [Actinobacteria bacterium]|jgi:uncharacterized protein (DUF302 family)|nr:DUF302 domain-containing protein [Actinomycetota bacterium]MCL6105047.1 DUF302 domain-containing protein [Actinomycetota bacterium]